MEKVFQLTSNGQQIQQADFGVIGDAAGRADDRVFAELLRMTPYNGSSPSRGILPYFYASATGSVGTVTPNGATGSVLVKPFRAFIGSRTTAATEARKYWRDIRSGLSVAEGATSTDTQLTLAANSSGNPRWDLVYAAVAVDANGAFVQRKIKDPVSKVISTSTVVTTLVTSVSVAVVTGTPGASPAFPARPSDSGGTYYIALAYVRVPNGFNATSTVANKDVNEVAPVLGISSSTGGMTVRPADQHNVTGGTAISGTGTSQLLAANAFAWGAAAGQRPDLYLPPGMCGGESIFFAAELLGTSANWSHQNGAIIDASRDWRNRLFRFTAVFGSNAGFNWPWVNSGSMLQAGYNPFVGGTYTTAGDSPIQTVAGFGNSWGVNTVGAVAWISTQNVGGIGVQNVTNPPMAAASSIGVGADGSGRLALYVNGTPGVWLMMWLDATGQFENP